MAMIDFRQQQLDKDNSVARTKPGAASGYFDYAGAWRENPSPTVDATPPPPGPANAQAPTPSSKPAPTMDIQSALGSLSGILGRYTPLINLNTAGGSGGSAPPRATLNTGGFDESTQGRVNLNPASFGPQDATEYQNAAFGRAKAQAGSLGRSSLDSLRGELAGRGILGSGTEIRGTVDRLAAATNPLADLNVAHLGQNFDAANRAADIANSRSLAEFQGGISQRGQDQGVTQALNALRASQNATQFSGDISQRGQDQSAEQNANALAASQASTQFQGELGQQSQSLQALMALLSKYNIQG